MTKMKYISPKAKMHVTSVLGMNAKFSGTGLISAFVP